MSNIGDLIQSRAEKNGMSLRALCIKANLRYPTIHRALSEGRDLPFRSVEALAKALSVPLATFAGDRAIVRVAGELGMDTNAEQSLKEADVRAIENGLLVSTDMVLDWLEREKGVLRNYAFLQNKIDLFLPAKVGDKAIIAAEIGAQSLAAIFFDLKETSEYANKFQQLSKEVRLQTVANHVAVQTSNQYRVEPVEIRAKLNGVKIQGRYRRIMAPVTRPDGTKLTLVFARLSQAFQPSVNVETRPDYNP